MILLNLDHKKIPLSRGIFYAANNSLLFAVFNFNEVAMRFTSI